MRWEKAEAISVEHPELRLGGVTNSWVKQSLKTGWKTKSIARKISIAILMFQAGADQRVKLPRQDLFCQKTKSCKKVTFPLAYHEILMEKDFIRDEALAELKKFFAAHELHRVQ